jgi:hypothetical protein
MLVKKIINNYARVSANLRMVFRHTEYFSLLFQIFADHAYANEADRRGRLLQNDASTTDSQYTYTYRILLFRVGPLRNVQYVLTFPTRV